MSKFLKLDTDKRYFLEVDKIIREYSELYMKAEDNWENMWELLVEQVLGTLWFGFLSLVAVTLILSIIFEYILSTSFTEIFNNHFYTIVSIWAFIVLTIITNKKLRNLKHKYTLDNLELGIQMYRQNLYHAQQKLKPTEFKKFIEKECDTGKAELVIQFVDDYKYRTK